MLHPVLEDHQVTITILVQYWKFWLKRGKWHGSQNQDVILAQ